MQQRFGVYTKVDRLVLYAQLLHHQDTRDATHQAAHARATSLAAKFEQAASWLTPAILAIPRETVDGWLTDSAALATYRHYLEDAYRRKPHVLSPREEELLAMSAEPLRATADAYGLLTNADMTFPTITDADGQRIQLSEGRYLSLLESRDRCVREEAFKGVVGSYAKFRNTAAALLEWTAKAHWFEARARGYSSCLDAALAEDNIPVEVFDNLVGTVNSRLDLLHRYAANRKAVNLSKTLYTEGQTDFLSVLDAQRSLFATEETLALSTSAVSTDLVALYKAIGGGWDADMAEVGAPATK